MIRTCTVIVPVKSIAAAKTRLGFDLETRRDLAAAFVTDLVDACLHANRVRRVIVVGDARLPEGLAVERRPDPGSGLNGALESVATTLPSDEFTAALVGDLPCARPDDVDLLLELALDVLAGEGSPSFLPDQPGLGTTAVLADADGLRPLFGKRSRAAHRQAGFQELSHAGLARLRRDVDSQVDLFDAVRQGVGFATRDSVRRMPLTVSEKG